MNDSDNAKDYTDGYKAKALSSDMLDNMPMPAPKDYQRTDIEKEFEAEFGNVLDYTRRADCWGRAVYLHPHVESIYSGFKHAWLRATVRESVELSLLKESIAEQLQENSGYWYSCSGCHESGECGENAGNYPYSDMFKCHPGSGCHECGGIGVLWDDTDYSALLQEAQAAVRPQVEKERKAEGSVENIRMGNSIEAAAAAREISDVSVKDIIPIIVADIKFQSKACAEDAAKRLLKKFRITKIEGEKP